MGMPQERLLVAAGAVKLPACVIIGAIGPALFFFQGGLGGLFGFRLDGPVAEFDFLAEVAADQAVGGDAVAVAVDG